MKDEMPFVVMNATIEITLTCPWNKEMYFDIGDFEFKINDKEIQFGFDASGYSITPIDANTIQINYESGHGPFFNDFNVSKEYFESWNEQNIEPHQITAEYLSKATDILEFYIDVDNPKERSLSSTSNIEKASIKSITFSNEKAHSFAVDKNVIESYTF